MKINIKNKTEVNKIVRFISKDKSSKINIDNLINPTLSLKTSEENGDSLSFCLAPEDCIPLVDKVSCLCLDITKNYKVTVDGEEFTGSFQACVNFLDTKGLYMYPSENLCNPCFNTFSSLGFDVDSLINFTQEVYDISVALYVNDEFVKDIQLSSDYYGKYAWLEILSQIPGVSYRSQKGDGYYDYYPRVYFINPTNNKINVKLEFGEDFYNLVDGYHNDFHTDDRIILEEDSTSYSFCFEPTEELDCNYTTEIMKADVYPTSNSNTRIIVNGVEYSLSDLEGEPSDDLPVLIIGDSYGISFQNNTYDCIEVLVSNTTYEYDQVPGSYFGYHLIAPNFSGTMLEIGSNYYKFKLAPKESVESEYALPVVSASLLTDTGWTPSDVLDTISSYLFHVNVTKDKDWLDYEENWSATVEINGETFEITNETVSFNVPLGLSRISPSFSDQYVDVSAYISSNYDYIEDREFFNETYTVLSYYGLIPSNLLQVGTIVTGQEVYSNSTAESPTTHNILENRSWPREGIFKFKMSPSLLGHGLSVKSGENLYPITSEMSIPYSNLYYTTFSNPRISETARLSIINSEGRHLITLNYTILNNTTVLSEENLGYAYSWSTLRVGSTYNFKITGFHPSVTKVALVDWTGNNGEPLDSQSPFNRNQEYNVNNGTLTLPAKTLTSPYTSYVSYPTEGYLWFSIHARIVESTDPELVGKSVLSFPVNAWVIS